MKKLILSVAIVLGCMSTIPATAQASEKITKTETTTQDYKEIKLEELPEALKTAVSKSYPGAVINNAYVSEAKEYKLNLTVDGKTGAVYADAAGNWIKK